MTVDIICADAREGLARFPDGHFHCCVCSPPYWGLRDYGLEPTVWGPDCEHEWLTETRQPQHSDDGAIGSGLEGGKGTQMQSQRSPVTSAFCRRCNAWRGTLGLEPTPELYVEHMVAVMREVRRVLRDDGTCWINLGDSYNAAGRDGHGTRVGYKQGTNWASATGADGNRPTAPTLKPKDLVGVPWRVAFALQTDGWWLRSDIVWSKPNPMPESVTDRPTRAHEYLFLLTKSQRYYYDQDAIREISTDHRVGTIQPRFSDKITDDVGQMSHHTRIGLMREREYEPSRNRRSVWEIATQPFSAAALGSGHQAREGEDAGGGGKRRITSPSCPVHGDSFDPASTHAGGGHGAEGRQSHTERSQTRRALGHIGDFGSIQPPPGQQSEADSSGSPRQQSVPAANGHSTESHRMARDPETSQPCTPSAETDGRTGGRSELPLFAASGPDTPGSIPSGDSSGGEQAKGDGETEWSRLRRCTCSWVDDTTEPDHFATFPEKLVEPCIMTTSEWGCCPECGAPWERVVEREPNQRRQEAYTAHGQHRGTLRNDDGIGGPGSGALTPTVTTTGWRPTCKHEAEPVPCRVLDPFAGSGTVGLVAERLGRHSVLIDAKEEYCEMARHRTAQRGLML